MRFVSLFAGVGGFDLGLEKAGMTCVGQVEIDKHAISVLEKHWPNVPKHDDVQTAKEWADATGLVGAVDLVCGGFPCQDLSIGGKRAGLAGERSGLFYDALNFATHVKAKWVILENVEGLFSSNNGHDFMAVIREMRLAGYSYVEWRLFNSQFYGVPQRRRRVYIVGHIGDPNRFPLFVERESGSRNHAQSAEQGQNPAPETARSTAEGSVFGQSSFAGYTEGPTTLTATTYKRPEDNIAVIPYTSTSFAQYDEGVGTVRASGGDLGGGSETLVVRDVVD